jgi:hypothetical protein
LNGTITRGSTSGSITGKVLGFGSFTGTAKYPGEAGTPIKGTLTRPSKGQVRFSGVQTVGGSDFPMSATLNKN